MVLVDFGTAQAVKQPGKQPVGRVEHRMGGFGCQVVLVVFFVVSVFWWCPFYPPFFGEIRFPD